MKKFLKKHFTKSERKEMMYVILFIGIIIFHLYPELCIAIFEILFICFCFIFIDKWIRFIFSDPPKNPKIEHKTPRKSIEPSLLKTNSQKFNKPLSLKSKNFVTDIQTSITWIN